MTLERIVLHDLRGLALNENGQGKQRAPLLPVFGSSTPTPPPAPVLSEADLKASEETGYRKGFLDGEKEGRMLAESEQARINQDLRDALSNIGKHIEALISNYNAFVAQSKAMLPSLALAIAKKIAGDALQANALPAMEQTIADCLHTILGEAHIHVTVHEKLASTLETHLASLFAHRQDPGEISILGNPDMALGDFRIEWKQGYAERNTAALWAQLESMIQGITDAVRREPPALSLPETP